nr:MAG TPA: Nuclease [Caudoviricetes sp.]
MPPERKTMLEKTIEQALVRATKKAGGIAPKLTSPANAGMPDRIIILPNGKICFVELKAPGQKPRPLQIRQMQRLANLGCMVRTLDNPQKIPELINEIRTA